MAIRFTKYIDITSGVGAGTTVATRDLIARLFTTNTILPPNSYIEFDTATEVGAYFGTNSEEYKRAVFYFSYISESITSPQKISYARWSTSATAPSIRGAVLTRTPINFAAISDGSFTLTLGTTTHLISGLDFTSVLNMNNVATIIQAGINAQTGTQWTAATVTYNLSRNSLDFVGGSTGNAVLSVAAGTTGTNIASFMGWYPNAPDSTTGAIWSDGSSVESITDTLIASDQASDNFGSFLFIPSLTIDQVVEAATWNKAENVKYQYHVGILDTVDPTTYTDVLSTIGGVGLTVVNATTALYHEMMPMAFLAATRYDQRNSTINYMFKQYPASTATVSTDAASDSYDALRVNYYGITQTAGRQYAFYQRGFLQGIDTDPVDMNTYANEQWFKDAAGAGLMTLLLALPKISANALGVSQILTVLQSVIDQALSNGTISVQGVLSTAQKLYIQQITGDPNAWYQIQNIGYWVSCVMESYVTTANVLEYKAVYTLVYKKDDVVRKVEGKHVLI